MKIFDSVSNRVFQLNERNALVEKFAPIFGQQ